MCYWSENAHQTARRRNNNRNIECLLSTCCGKVQLTHDLKCSQLDILGLVEVRCTGFAETTMDEGHKIFYCGEDSKHQFGVAFIHGKKL